MNEMDLLKTCSPPARGTTSLDVTDRVLATIRQRGEPSGPDLRPLAIVAGAAAVLALALVPIAQAAWSAAQDPLFALFSSLMVVPQ